MKYYIIAGEASGDLHGSNLINEIIKIDSEAEIRGWGGDKMKKAGAKIIKHYKNKSETIELGNIDITREFNDIEFVCKAYRGLLEADAKSKIVNIAFDLSGFKPSASANS